MRRLRAIVGREVGAFFHSAMAPVVLTGFLVAVGLFFTLFVFAYSEMSLTAMQSARSGNYLNLAEGLFRPLVSNMTLFLLLLMPAVTMRLFASDYRSGRWDLVASWPVPDLVWVVGKWLSALAVAVIIILASGAYFGAVAVLGDPEAGPVVAAWTGLLLLSAALAAWGVLASSLFGHQIIAYFGAFAWSMVLFLVGALARYLPGLAGDVAREMSFLGHFERFSRGVLDSRDVVFFLLMTVVPLVAAAAVLSGRRQPAGRRTLLGTPPLLTAAVAVVLYVLAVQFPGTADLTANKRYSLAPQTLRILADLPDHLAEAGEDAEAVEVLAFYQRLDPAYDVTEALLKACAQHGSAFRYRMLDPETELELVREYGVKVARSMAVVAGDRSTVVLQPDESGLINAVYRMATGRSSQVYHVLGHGEHLPDSDAISGYGGFTGVLEDQGYRVRELQLPLIRRIPADADVLVIAGPRTEPGPGELAAMEDYLRGGGAVLALFDPPTPRAWVTWLARWRVGLTGDVIIPAQRSATEFGVQARTVVIGDTYGSHEISNPLMGVATVFPLAQALATVGEPDSVVAGAVLLRTDPAVWAETDPAQRFSGAPRFDRERDRVGPLDFGMVLELALAGADAPRGRMVVVGNSEFLTNANLNLGGNRDLALNALGWLAREEALIELRGRDPLSQPLVLSLSARKALGWGAILGWPLIVGSLALGVMLRHRRLGGGA
jgi:ABC-type transport system involved in multi-copper enzyme maturation permease subunit